MNDFHNKYYTLEWWQQNYENIISEERMKTNWIISTLQSHTDDGEEICIECQGFNSDRIIYVDKDSLDYV